MKNKHQQVVDLSNANEGQYTVASTSAIKINHNLSKQTSVEWLISQILKEGKILDLDVEAAKAMHRQENEDSFVAGSERGTNDIPFNCEQYYTQTFGKKTN